MNPAEVDVDLAEEAGGRCGILEPYGLDGHSLSDDFEDLLRHHRDSGDPPGLALTLAVSGFMSGEDEGARRAVLAYVAAMLGRAHPAEYGSVFAEIGMKHDGPDPGSIGGGAGLRAPGLGGRGPPDPQPAGGRVHLTRAEAKKGRPLALKCGIAAGAGGNSMQFTTRFASRMASYLSGDRTPAGAIMAAVGDFMPDADAGDVHMVAVYVAVALRQGTPEIFGHILDEMGITVDGL